MTEEWAPDPDQILEVDAALSEWRQGDVLRSADASQLIVADGSRPLTLPAADAAAEVGTEEEGLVLVQENVEAFVITSQTCEVVQSCANEPELLVSPLVRLPDGIVAEAAAGWRPRYAPVPGEGANAFADLGKTMTLQKAAVTSWDRTEGLRSDVEIRRFQGIAERRVGRFAFPNDLTPATDELYTRLRKKRGNDSFEGRAIVLVEEIRLLGIPDWASSSIEVDIYFLVSTEAAMRELEEHQASLKPQKGQIDTWEGCRAEWE